MVTLCSQISQDLDLIFHLFHCCQHCYQYCINHIKVVRLCNTCPAILTCTIVTMVINIFLILLKKKKYKNTSIELNQQYSHNLQQKYIVKSKENRKLQYYIPPNNYVTVSKMTIYYRLILLYSLIISTKYFFLKSIAKCIHSGLIERLHFCFSNCTVNNRLK